MPSANPQGFRCEKGCWTSFPDEKTEAKGNWARAPHEGAEAPSQLLGSCPALRVAAASLSTWLGLQLL